MAKERRLYPLVFAPIYKDKIWGGDKIRSVLGKDYGDLPNCGESWEVSAVPGQVSVVAEGPLKGRDLSWLIGEYGAELLGESVFGKYGAEFPLLVKFISAADDLSIQVHPDDAMAAKYHGGFGKTEMWYVLDADPGAELIYGFDREMTREMYLEYFHAGRLEELLRRVPVKKGDCFFLPPGRVHSIGRGILLAEIQQSSDITYRIYDFDRVDAGGRKRELHVELALEAMDFSVPEETGNRRAILPGVYTELAACPYFSTGIVRADRATGRDFSSTDSFVVFTCTAGAADVVTESGSVAMRVGVCVLLPASIRRVEVRPADGGVEWLETVAR